MGKQFIVSQPLEDGTVLAKGIVASACVVEEGGRVSIRSGGRAVSTDVLGGGYLYVEANGSASNIVVASHGNLDVASKGNINGVRVMQGGIMYIARGGRVQGLEECGGTILVEQGAHVSFKPTVVRDSLILEDHVTVHSGTVFQQGRVGDNGKIYIFSGGIVDGMAISEFGWMEVNEGGLARAVDVQRGGMLLVSGGTATDGIIAGFLNAMGHAFIQQATVVSGGEMHVHDGCTSVDLRISSGGNAVISAGGVFSNGWVGRDGELYTQAGAVLLGRIYVDGTLHTTESGSVDAHHAELIFRVDETEHVITGAINGLENIHGAQYVLQVSPELADGMYAIVTKDGDFPESFTVKNASDAVCGTLIPGETCLYNTRAYTLLQDEKNQFSFRADSIALTHETIAPVRADILQTAGKAVTVRSVEIEYAGRFVYTVQAPDGFCGSVVLRQGKKKWTLKNGKSYLLDSGTYELTIQTTKKMRAQTVSYSLAVSTPDEAYLEAIGGEYDDWTDMNTAGANGGVGSWDIAEAMNDWVGFGDNTDWKVITLNHPEKLWLDIQTTDSITVTIAQLTEKQNARTGVTTYSTKTSQKTVVKGAKTCTTNGILLTAGTYYVCVKSTNASKGGRAAYGLNVNAEKTIVFDNAYNDVSNNTWADARELGVFSLEELANRRDYVGFGDGKDYIALGSPADDGVVDIFLDADVPAYAKLTVYAVGSNNSLKVMKRNAKLGGYQFRADTEYALLIQSADNGKGKKNTEYSVCYRAV